MKKRVAYGLILVAVVAALALVVWFATRSRTAEPPTGRDPEGPQRYGHEELVVKSSDLEVGPATVKRAVYPGFSSWLVTMACAEAEGCAGSFSLQIDYHTGSQTRALVVTTECDVAFDSELRFEGLEEPPAPVERIEDLSLQVIERGVHGEPTPIEIEL